jgi:hypothetical protein
MLLPTWFPFVPRAHAEAIAADLDETRAKLDAALRRLDALESKLAEHDTMFSDVPDYWGIRQEIDQRLDELHLVSAGAKGGDR